jgi:hypothetical protein
MSSRIQITLCEVIYPSFGPEAQKSESQVATIDRALKSALEEADVIIQAKL